MEHIQEVLDQIESEVEILRSKALKLKEDQKNTFKILKTIVQSSQDHENLSDIDKEEIEATVQRLHGRLSSIGKLISKNQFFEFIF